VRHDIDTARQYEHCGGSSLVTPSQAGLAGFELGLTLPRVSQVMGWPPGVGCAGRASRKGGKWVEAMTRVGRGLKRTE
jgi:hypothetical protein